MKSHWYYRLAKYTDTYVQRDMYYLCLDQLENWLQYSHIFWALSINLIIILKTILFNKKSPLKILQALLQANQSVRIHVVVICICPYRTVNLFKSVNIVNITCNPINNMLFVVLAVSTHVHIWFIHTVQLNLNLTAHACSNCKTWHVSENACKKACMCTKDWWHSYQCMSHACTHKTLFCCIKSVRAFLVCMNWTCAFWFAWARVFNRCAVWLGIYTNNMYT